MKRVAFSMLVMLPLFGVVLSSCAVSFSQSSGSLQLSEHQLAKAPEFEPLRFEPLRDSQEAILAEHASERAMVISNEVITVQGNPAIRSLGESGDLLAVLFTATQGQPVQEVKLLRGDKIIFETDAGLPSPALPLQGLWTYDGHWALEILFADQSIWAGEVFIDGELVNGLKRYDEAFGLQLLAGKPFFFYQRSGRVGYSYDGKETELNYDEVPHYRCCGESVLNPIQAHNMVAFFAVRDTTWFYAELGNFDG